MLGLKQRNFRVKCSCAYKFSGIQRYVNFTFDRIYSFYVVLVYKESSALIIFRWLGTFVR